MNDYLESGDYFIASIDGNRCKNLKSFLFEIGRAFGFPEHYGMNMSALDDCLNDLDWIEKDNYVLVINNNESFIIDSHDDRVAAIEFLNEIADEWKNYAGEDNDEYRKKSDFVIIYN